MAQLIDLLLEHWIWVSIIAFLIFISIWGQSPRGQRYLERQQENAVMQRATVQAELRAKAAPPDGFLLTQELLSYDRNNGIGLDEKNRQIWLITRGVMRKRTLAYNELLSVELNEDGQSVSSTARKSQAAGVVIGALALGGFGALVGGLTAKRNQTAVVNKLTMRLVINDSNNPIHEVVLLNAPKTLKTSPAYQRANAVGRHWQAVLDVIMRQADEADQVTPRVALAAPSSVADEIRKLGLLRQEGLLSDSEFQAQKARLLNSA